MEDDTILSELEKILLEKLGYHVCGHADNARDAITGIQKKNPDLVLLDIELHENYEGILVGDFLNSKTNIPFIYVSGHDDKLTIEKARKTVPDGFLLKPFNDSQLRVAIEMAVR
ncbi:response regulator [uncultured Methanoregula sp.]|uniref:response regulator n=1 Tax=uncultured Methanoregula sp. TaxID=1005933 RepID=UPI002AAB7BC6|nr:response regulator [uncultured Methanoregula sp.]